MENKFELDKVNTNFISYQQLINLHNTFKNSLFEDIHINIHNFFMANMSSVLGAIIDIFISNLNSIYFDKIDSDIEKILLKNNFLSYHGRIKENDLNNTTIQYIKLNRTDGKFFKTYLIEELIENHLQDLPKMSNGVKEKIIETIYEIFVNAQIHSDTKHIYTCGQFYPNKNIIEFTIVDTGIGFKNKINKTFNTNLTSIQAIKWAIQDKNTSKENSGGIGLAFIHEFIKLNNGQLQIISNEGFYEFNGFKTETKNFMYEFPGTIVNLQFNTNDSNEYVLTNEININEIF